MQRIGLFGGSFDPGAPGPSAGGAGGAGGAGLARLFFIPAAQSPFKPESASRRRRQSGCACLRLALAGKTWCEIDEQEIQRGGISYTIDTVRDYAGRFPEAQFFYLIGADHVRATAEVARSGGTGATGGVRGHSPARAGGDAISRAVSRAMPGGLSAGRFVLANSRAGEGGLADRAPGSARRWRRRFAIIGFIFEPVWAIMSVRWIQENWLCSAANWQTTKRRKTSLSWTCVSCRRSRTIS